MDEARRMRDVVRGTLNKAHDALNEALREAVELETRCERQWSFISKLVADLNSRTPPAQNPSQFQAINSAIDAYERSFGDAARARDRSNTKRKELEEAEGIYETAQEMYDRAFEQQEREWAANRERRRRAFEERRRADQRSHADDVPRLALRSDLAVPARRIAAEDIVAFLTETKTIDYANLQVFPAPPAELCGRVECARSANDRALEACPCNIRTVFTRDAIKIKTERLRWHPDKFAQCPEVLRATFQKKAQEIFVALSNML
jgi:hypothetical protein